MKSWLWMKKILLLAMIGLLMVSNYKAYGEEEELEVGERIQYILILNAYHQGYGWTDQCVEGFFDSFNDDEKVIIFSEYLDWKRYPTQENLDSQLEILRKKYRNKKIDLVIGTDDIGMQFAIDHREELFPNTPIVFTGVYPKSAKERMKGVTNITGVYEVIDATGVLETIFLTRPKTKNIYILADGNESGQDGANACIQAIKGSGKNLSYQVLDHHSYLQIEEILKYPKKESVVIVASMSSDSNGKNIPDTLYINMLSKIIDLPIYTPYEYMLGHGVLGGSLLSAKLQGEQGAKLAKKILKGASADDLEIVHNNLTYYGFDYVYMQKYNVGKEILPKDRRIINQPVIQSEAYKRVIEVSVISLLILLFFILVLVWNITQRKKAQKDLHKEHGEVILAYEALVASEEELKAQNEELEAHQERIYYLAYNDYLTHLPNRLQIQRLSRSMIEEVKKKGTKLMMFFIDLDNFNYINTAHGHLVGDQVLGHVANKLKMYLETEGVVGRVGGDEFICIKEIGLDFDLKAFTKGLTRTINSMISIGNLELYNTASIGYAIYPDDGKSYTELFTRADIAMSKMKEKGKGRISRFNFKMDKEKTNKINLTRALQVALERNEFRLVYQPQYNQKTKRITGYEALLRWDSGILGRVSPAEFIPVAEEIGLIVELGYFIIDQAFQFCKRLNQKNEGLKVAVNISVVQLLRMNFANKVQVLCEKYELNTKWIEFEITESVLIESFDIINNQLEKITNLGIQIALDDFGTGYSSLTYLKKLPISTLKIDKAFIDDIIDEGDAHFFTGIIIDIGRKLGFRVVAEGVEEDVQMAYLMAHNCHVIQGYWFSRPIEEEEVFKRQIEI